MKSRRPRDDTDASCYDHDLAYERYGKKNAWHRYVFYNQADEKVIGEFDQQPGIMPWMYSTAFKIKKVLNNGHIYDLEEDEEIPEGFHLKPNDDLPSNSLTQINPKMEDYAAAYEYLSKFRRRRGRRRKRKPWSTKRRVRYLLDLAGGTIAKKTYRQRDTGSIQNVNNSVSFGGITGNDVNSMYAALTSCKVFNPAVPGTPFVVDMSTPAFAGRLFVQSCSSTLHLRNNALTDLFVIVYLVRPTGETSKGVETYLSELDGDYGISPGQPLWTLADIKDAMAQWTIHKRRKFVIRGNGGTYKISHKTGKYHFDNSFIDTHALLFQKRLRSFQWLIRVEGTLARDATTGDLFGRACGELQWENTREWVVKYDGGYPFDDYELVDNSNAMTSAVHAVNDRSHVTCDINPGAALGQPEEPPVVEEEPV